VLHEKRRSVIEANMANIWANISSTKSSCICLVRVFAVSGMVEAVVNFGGGGEGIRPLSNFPQKYY
jgi:hypothetical protein